MDFKKLAFGRVNREIDDKLFLACQDGLESLFDQAIADGANPNAYDVFSHNRPIHVAVTNGKTTIVRKLLANPEVRLDLHGARWLTPLELAQSKGYKVIETVLVEHMATVGHNGPGRPTQRTRRLGLHRSPAMR
jgi:hypothetical protein